METTWVATEIINLAAEYFNDHWEIEKNVLDSFKYVQIRSRSSGGSLLNFRNFRNFLGPLRDLGFCSIKLLGRLDDEAWERIFSL